MKRQVAIAIETGSKRTFATAIDWPGWSRAGKTAEEAIEALLGAAPRYAAVAKLAGDSFTAPSSEDDLDLKQRVKGDASTDFGIPAADLDGDDAPLEFAELDRLTALLEASWTVFDEASKAAVGKELRKGPRGGGRDLDKIIGHVHEADDAYLRQLGSKSPGKSANLRTTMLETLSARARGEPVANPTRVKHPWTPRYFVRRTAWHALDHAWEIEDRAKPVPR
jgi:hypothetical protein